MFIASVRLCVWGFYLWLCLYRDVTVCCILHCSGGAVMEQAVKGVCRNSCTHRLVVKAEEPA